MSRHFYHTLLLALLAVTVVSVSAEDGDGGYAGSWLQVPIGARPTAMGGAYLGVSNDGSGPLFNPAGTADLQRPVFTSSYRFMDLDRKLGYAGVLFPVRGNSSIGVNWLYAGSGDVTARNSDGDALGYELSQNNHVFNIVFAKRFEDFLSLGMNAYYLHSQFAEMVAYSVGVDVGAMLYLGEVFGRERKDLLPVQDWHLGITVKHLEATYTWNNEEYLYKYVDGTSLGTEQQDKVPVEIGVGMSGKFMERRLLLAADVIKNMDQGVDLHAGGEYLVRPDVALRAGFSDGRITAGAGYVFKLGTQDISVDYAFSTDKADEGSEHIFSFDLRF